jgi:hypothetical protein
MPAKARPKGRRWNHELDVVGLNFRLKRVTRDKLGDIVAKGSVTGIRLRREPDNHADPNAIQVLLPERLMHGAHIGYLRAPSAELLAPKLDSGALEVVSAKLLDLDETRGYDSGTLHVVFRDVPRAERK